MGTLAAVRIDLVGTTADFRCFGPRLPLPINYLLCQICRTLARIGEVGLTTPSQYQPHPERHRGRFQPRCIVARLSHSADRSAYGQFR